jgi:hypothetical protein
MRVKNPSAVRHTELPKSYKLTSMTHFGELTFSLKLRGTSLGVGTHCFVISTGAIAEWICQTAGREIAFKIYPLT